MSDVITFKKALEKGYCVSGIRKFCANNNIDFRSFVKYGITKEKILQTNDQMAIDLIGDIDG